MRRRRASHRDGVFPFFGLAFAHELARLDVDAILADRSMPGSRRRRDILAFLARDADARVFANSRVRKSEQNDEILRFAENWRRRTGSPSPISGAKSRPCCRRTKWRFPRAAWSTVAPAA